MDIRTENLQQSLYLYKLNKGNKGFGKQYKHI